MLLLHFFFLSHLTYKRGCENDSVLGEESDSKNERGYLTNSYREHEGERWEGMACEWTEHYGEMRA